MPLDGLRAWIGEVERKLGMRTRVFLVLAVIAIGGAGAAIYLAIEAQNDSVSESDVQALQEKLEARIDEGGGAVSPLGAEGQALPPEAEAAPSGGGGTGGGAGTGDGGGTHKGASGGGGGGEGSPSAGAGDGSGGGSAGSGASGGGSASRLEELLKQTKEANQRAEREQAEGK